MASVSLFFQHGGTVIRYPQGRDRRQQNPYAVNLPMMPSIHPLEFKIKSSVLVFAVPSPIGLNSIYSRLPL